jgi:hypothetical protein
MVAVWALPSGLSIPARQASGVDFPDLDGPVTATNSPLCPAGLLCGAAVMTVLRVAEPVGAVSPVAHPASTARVATVATSTVNVCAAFLMGLTSDMPAAWRSVVVDTLRSHRWRCRILLYWVQRVDEPEMEAWCEFC